MLNKNQEFGKNSESDAAEYLSRRGYKILEKNYRTKLGEIDIIAREKDTIVFVEVKARTSEKYGDPKLAVSYGKQKKIARAAQIYLKSTNQGNQKARFDVVAIHPHDSGKGIEIVRNAFSLPY